MLDAAFRERLIPVRSAPLAPAGDARPLRRSVVDGARKQRRAQALTGNNQAQFLAQIATLEGDHAAAVECWREHCDLLERHGDRAALSTAAPLLGRSLCAPRPARRGRAARATRARARGRERHRDAGRSGGNWKRASWRHVVRPRAARTLAHEAVELAERTDGLNMQGDALCDLAEVLAGSGHDDEAAMALEQALDRYERKNLANAGPGAPEARGPARADPDVIALSEARPQQLAGSSPASSIARCKKYNETPANRHRSVFRSLGKETAQVQTRPRCLLALNTSQRATERRPVHVERSRVRVPSLTRQPPKSARFAAMADAEGALRVGSPRQCVRHAQC